MASAGDAPRRRGAQVYDVVGPMCEIGRLAGARARLALQAGRPAGDDERRRLRHDDGVELHTRGRAAEVMVDGDQVHLVRRREKAADLFALESLIK